VSSDLTWQVYGGVGYAFTDWFDARVGYRYLVDDYESEGFVLDVSVQGFLVGLAFRF
jgi:opacity protein-like surface antigen